ncbi:MAG: hypothetical protein N2Z40_02590 [Caldimicrobium sp.]|nr:hypothetical protein [Caldimicrobium sp.]MCX7613096.1 hypothetical protein [Caldimicrobium sp.]MDW8183051.1 hypothetical protein [Caldimicrobium sp.]
MVEYGRRGGKVGLGMYHFWSGFVINITRIPLNLKFYEIIQTIDRVKFGGINRFIYLDIPMKGFSSLIHLGTLVRVTK